MGEGGFGVGEGEVGEALWWLGDGGRVRHNIGAWFWRAGRADWGGYGK